MVCEHGAKHPSQWAAIMSIAGKLGCTTETLRRWVRQAQRDTGQRAGLTTDERQRLRELERENLELSQEHLAERADLHRNYVGGIERGERNVGLINVGKLADALDVSVADLFATFTQKPARRRS